MPPTACGNHLFHETTGQQMNGEFNWDKLYKIGGIAALSIVFIIPIQIALFTVFPLPETSKVFLDLFHENWISTISGNHRGRLKIK
jgi:hypothetical protein